VTRSAQEIQDWLVARVSGLAEVPPEAVDVRAPLTRRGLDSVALVVLVADLEQWLGYRFRDNPLDAHPTIEALSRFLEGQVGEGRRPG
jgi:acyl carrier protein